MNTKPSVESVKRTTPVFNISRYTLTKSMESLLSRGLNFAILPKKLDITQVLVDFRRFKRSVTWMEFWHNRETDKDENTTKIFKTEKTNMPKNHVTPEGLNVFLNSIKSEIMDPRNRNEAECNLPVNELNALKELIKLEKERNIVIKQCDKGAGLMVMNFEDYLNACCDHLYSVQTNKLGEEKKYYRKVEEKEQSAAIIRIKEVLDEGLIQGFLNKEEHKAMDAFGKEPAKFYANPKVHKKHVKNTVPPLRPIISGAGGMCENIGKFVEHHIKHIATKHEAYLQDTPHFLRSINAVQGLDDKAMLVTMDVKALFTNISHEEGLKSMKEKLDERVNKEVPTEYLTKLMEILLKNNLFRFNEDLFLQDIGAPMGSSPVPNYADMFMDKNIDGNMKMLAKKFDEGYKTALKFLKRFLDDLFLIWIGTSKSLHKFLQEVNSINPTIELTMSHTAVPGEATEDRCDCDIKDSVSFLDTECKIVEGIIETNLYRKPSDRNQYLLPSSCHPKQTTRAIPFSLATRIIRICSNKEKREIEFSKLKELLLEREYKLENINSAIEKAKAIPRANLLKPKIQKEKSRRPVFAVQYDPRQPSLQGIAAKHWRSMVSRDAHLQEVFPEPPLIAFKRQRNLRDHLIRAKVPETIKPYPERNLKGMTKCNKIWCSACPYVQEGKYIKIKKQKNWFINKTVNCNSFNIVYLIECNKESCKQRYVGETKRHFRKRLAEHRSYIQNKHLEQATGAHFNLPGHSVANMKMTIIEQVKTQSDSYRKEREEFYIRKLDTFNNGMNKKH